MEVSPTKSIALRLALVRFYYDVDKLGKIARAGRSIRVIATELRRSRLAFFLRRARAIKTNPCDRTMPDNFTLVVEAIQSIINDVIHGTKPVYDGALASLFKKTHQ